MSLIRLKEKLIARGGTHALLSLERLFVVLDPDGDGLLTEDELKRGLADFEIGLNPAEMKEIFNYLDDDANGFINVDEFMLKIRGSLTKQRKELVVETFSELIRRTHPDNDCLSLDDLEVFYNPAWQSEVKEKTQTEAEALREFVFQVKRVQQGTGITLEDFLRYYTSVSPCCETEEGFKSMLESSWGVNLEVKLRAVKEPTASPKVTEPQETQGRKDGRSFHEEQAVIGKSRAIPKWVKYDRMVLNFHLYSLEPVSLYQGKFDHLSRDFKPVETDSFVVQTFVLSYYVQDRTITIHTTSAHGDGASDPPRRFLSRCNMNDYIDGDLTGLTIGKELRIKGKRFVVYDADKATRKFYQQNLPQINIGHSLPLPQAKSDSREEEETTNEGKTTLSRSGKRNDRITFLKDNNMRPTRNFIENDGKILQFDCSWNDTSEYGDTRIFKLFFHMVDDTIELREVNQRNSGRERNALLNLRRDKLINPESSEELPQCYTWQDIKIGGRIYAFGRVLNVTGCNAFTRTFLNRNQRPNQDESNQMVPQSMKSTPKYRLYSAEFQRVDHLVCAIKKTVETRSNFATVNVQERNLKAMLKKHSTREDADKLTRAGFKQALASFSCFGSDTELLFEHVVELSKSQQDTEKKPESEELVSIQRFAEFLYRSDVRNEALSYGESCTSTKAASSIRPTAKLHGLLQALSAKLECATNFADKHKQKRLLDKILGQYSRERWMLTLGQLKGALSALNCWDDDAVYLFESYKVSHDYMNYKRLLEDVCAHN